jgi:(E)-4-hydroxy-3-methylbut-2-enyl-diphosphate synthase
VQDAGMIDHIVKLVEAKAAEIEAGISVSADHTHALAMAG